MPYSAIKVANVFLDLATASEPPRCLTPLQLLKLVYIANGWSLGLRNHPLVHESAEAWTYGPVIPELYSAIRHFRSSPITGPIGGDYDQQEMSQDDMDIVTAVYHTYGGLSGPQLSNMTHMPDTPWSLTWAGGAGQNQTIRSESIAKHYRHLRDRATA